MVQARAHIELEKAFVFKIETAKRIQKVLEPLGAVMFTTRCSDSIDRDYSSTDELDLADNSPLRAIKRIDISSGGHLGPAKIKFANGSFEPVEITISGEESVVEATSNALRSIALGTRPWYSFLTGTKIYLGLALVGGGAIAASGLATAAGWVRPAKDAPLTFSLFNAGWLMVFALMGLDKIKNYLFPVGVFYIGHGREQHDFREKIRWAVATTLVTSVLGSVGYLIKLVMTS